MKKKLVFLILVCMLLLSTVGCKSKTDATQNEDKRTEETQEAEETVLPTKDRAGNEITVPQNIDSIITLAPSIMESVVDLGFGDKIIAIDTNSVGLEGASKDLPAFDMMNPDVEKMAELTPSVILVSSMSSIDGQDPFKQLKDLGICVICIPTSGSIEAIKEDIHFLGQVLQNTEKSDEIVATMESEINKIAEIGKTITEKKKVYFEVAAAPSMYSVGSGAYLNEMIELIGAENVFADQEGWLSVEGEQVVNTNPDVILTNVNYIENPCDEIMGREGFEEVTAVKDKAIYYIDNMSSSLPNENIIKALQEMAKSVYPDEYKE